MEVKETKSGYEVTGEVECSACKGTGLYQGMAEHDGAAVVCNRCGGTGKVKVKLRYKKFAGRKKRKGVKRVFDGSHGFFISANDVTTEEREIPFSEWGCAYRDWLRGAVPVPMYGLICPYLHTNQHLQTEDVNGLYETRCRPNLKCGGSITKCPLWNEKDKCWEIFEEASDG